MSIIIVPSQPDVFALWRFFLKQAQHKSIRLPKIISVDHAFVENIAKPLSFEERWRARFLSASSFDEALYAEMPFVTKESYLEQKKEALIHTYQKKGIPFELACFLEGNTLEIDLEDGQIEATLSCASMQQEAYNIAILIRKNIERNRIAVVVGNQHLKRYIIQELKAWNLHIAHTLPLKYKFSTFLSFLRLGSDFAHETVLDILDPFDAEMSTFLELKLMRKGPCSYQKIEKYIPGFLKAYCNLSGQVRSFDAWCALYQDLIPPFWGELSNWRCSFEQFCQCAHLLLTQDSFFVPGNTNRVSFFSPAHLGFLSENIVILSNMSPETSFMLEHFNRALKTPSVYMTRHTKEKNNFWMDGHDITPYKKERSPLIFKPSKGDPLKRPTSFSVTEFERYIRDPYAIYAKKCLNLTPLGELNTPWRNVDFGILFHKVCEEIFKESITNLEEIFERHFSCVDQPLKYLFWKERFDRVMPFILSHEKPEKTEYHVHLQYLDFEIHGRIDRVNKDGVIVDYKTGTIPVVRDIFLGYSPQLLLEGLMLDEKKAQIWHIGQHDVKTIKIDIDLEEVENYVKKIIHKIRTGSFQASPIPSKMPHTNRYEHLERLF